MGPENLGVVQNPSCVATSMTGKVRRESRFASPCSAFLQNGDATVRGAGDEVNSTISVHHSKKVPVLRRSVRHSTNALTNSRNPHSSVGFQQYQDGKEVLLHSLAVISTEQAQDTNSCELRVPSCEFPQLKAHSFRTDL